MINLDLESGKPQTFEAPAFGKKEKFTFMVGPRLFEGDVCDLYTCNYSEPAIKGGTRFERIMGAGALLPGLLKVPRQAFDNDLVENEAAVLKELFPPGAVEEKFMRHLPKLIASVKVQLAQAGGKRAPCTANILALAEGYISVADILKAYPAGIDFRDMVWMFKRLLAALGFAHLNEYMHGAVLPAHVLVHPVQHGAKLIDWGVASKERRTRVLFHEQAAFYAPETLAAGHGASPPSDIYMAARIAFALVVGKDFNLPNAKMPDTVPKEVQTFLNACLDPVPTMRPHNAWDLVEELDHLLERTVGKPRYRPFKMPGA